VDQGSQLLLLGIDAHVQQSKRNDNSTNEEPNSSLSPAKDKVKWGFCSEVVNKSGLGNLSKTAVGGFATNFNEDFLPSPTWVGVMCS